MTNTNGANQSGARRRYAQGDTMRINPEAQLAVKLYRHEISTNTVASPEAQENRVLRDAAKLMSMARSLRRLYTSECNDNLPEPARGKRTARIVSLQVAVSDLLANYGLIGNRTMEETFNDDPRGYAVKIHFPDGSYNTMGGKEDGWGI